MSPDKIVTEFWRRRVRTTQRQLDILTQQFAIPIMALASDASGLDLPMVTMRVERGRGTFEFTDNEDVRPVCGFICWDEDESAQDIAAWSPVDGWVGTWLGRAALLNEHEISQHRFNEPLQVYLNVADWLRAHRAGVAIIDKVKAAYRLEGLTVQAVDVEAGVALRKIMERPRARIVVPAPQQDRVAA